MADSQRSTAAPERASEAAPKWNSELGIWENATAPASADFQLPPGDIWVFGYGSLTWKPSFPTAQMRRATLRGFARLFWQRSMDHRGTPAHPGAVVTLVTAADLAAQTPALEKELADVCKEQVLDVHGVACCIGQGPGADKILADLDFREKGGYSRSLQTVEFLDGTSVKALVYTGTAENPNFHPLSLDETADVIAQAVGPSGPNTEYLLNLERFLGDESSPSHDRYVTALCGLVRQRLSATVGEPIAGGAARPPTATDGESEKSTLKFPQNLRGLFMGSGSDGLQETEVFETILGLADLRPGGASAPVEDIRVLYIGAPSYDLAKPRASQVKRFVEASCKVESLELLSLARSGATELTQLMVDQIRNADIIVMSGGNTLFACDLMERLGVVPLLRHAMERGCVMCGGSAGAICWFDAGHSDSMDPSFYVDTAAATVDGIELPPTASPEAEKEREFLLRNWKYIKVPSMGFLPGLCCPHFDKTQSNGTPRLIDFQDMMRRHAGEIGIGIDHWAALVVRGQDFRVLSVDGRPGSVASDGTQSATQEGVPGVWRVEVVGGGNVVSRLLPTEGSLHDILRRATHAVEDPLLSAARAANSL